METRGLISRQPCPGDARGFNVVLTDAGLAAIEAAAPKHLVEVRRSFVDALTDEQLDLFGDIAEAIITHLAEQENNECCEDSPS
jgi:DNA-binding MarR family transcriptional regulator